MCIILYKPFGVEVPKVDKLKTCFESNSDGAGISWYSKDENLWCVEKGLMTFQKFMDKWDSKRFNEEDTIIAHFRIGTSGKKDEGNTHPFPVTSVLQEMTNTSFKSPGIACHNGVVGQGEGNYNDSMVYVRDYVAPLWPHLSETRIPEIMDQVLCKTSSKWIVTKGDMIWVFGHFNEHEGIKYSNYSHEEKKVYVAPNNNFRTGGGYLYNGKWVPFVSGSGSGNEYKEIAKSHVTPAETQWDEFKSQGKLKKILARAARGNTGKLVGVVSEAGDVQFTAKSKNIIDDAVSYLVCPNCFEEKYLLESPYNVGDTICVSCGAVFIDGTGKIVLYDLNIGKTKRGEAAQIKKKTHLTPEDRQKIINGTPQEDLILSGLY